MEPSSGQDHFDFFVLPPFFLSFFGLAVGLVGLSLPPVAFFLMTAGASGFLITGFGVGAAFFTWTGGATATGSSFPQAVKSDAKLSVKQTTVSKTMTLFIDSSCGLPFSILKMVLYRPFTTLTSLEQ
jgi:hypothetical protein